MTFPRRFSFVVLLLALVSSAALAQDAVAPPLALKGLDGKPVEVFEMGEKKAVVLFFVSPYCPTSNNFAPEMTSIEGDFTDAFAFRYIHSDPSVKSADILQHASMMGFVSPVLDDTAQVVAKQLGAKITPEVVVIDPAGIVLYQGRINDLYLGPTKRQREVKTNDLRDALTAIQAGKPVATARTEAVGCKITGVE
ncbi:MAG: redoxin domain-containing protein [Verrucomicrobiales bacterium]|jgi:thiol-disulfide isomerase/thioredoxin|nr:redoxin domain-containing protein [Verrucomicrobiales bacterium]MBP9222325.1 redoxin domain-containing protein [Verrucomicrobiales bacterium]HQZ28221.1 redoxin domain-containing protein [Verrucomicrobiales bacterium]